MKAFKLILSILILLTISYKSIAQSENKPENQELKNWANEGKVENNNFITEIPFKYIDGYIFIDIIQNNESYNFLFDTGADVTVIDKSIVDKFEFNDIGEMKISGPLITHQKKKRIVLSRLKISDNVFVNIGAVSFDLKFPKKKYCSKVHGIIGSTLLKKAKWQIDYKNQKIILTNDVSKLNIQNAKKIKMSLPSNGWGAETLKLNLDGIISDFVLDTGNGRNKMVSHPIYFSKLLRNEKNEISRYGLFKSESDFDVIINKTSLGDIILENQILSLEWEVGNNFKLLGNKFLENFLVTVDYDKHILYLEPVNEIKNDELIGFELGFSPNYITNQIEVKRGIKRFAKKNRIKDKTVLTEINGKNLIGLSHQEFCEFWNITWKKLMTKDKIQITLKQGKKDKEYILTKNKLSE